MGKQRKGRRGCEEPVLAGSLQTLPVYSPKLGWGRGGEGRGRQWTECWPARYKLGRGWGWDAPHSDPHCLKAGEEAEQEGGGRG